MNKFLAFLGFFIIIVICFSVFNIKNSLPIQNVAFVDGKIGENSIKFEIANNPVSRAKGLSNRILIREGEGMLFVFPEEDKYGFWMKDMKFSIDIIWVDRELRVVGVEKNISPLTYPASFYPLQAIQYVIEVPAGYFDKYGLKVGDEVFIESQNLILEHTF